MPSVPITSPRESAFAALCQDLSARAADNDNPAAEPAVLWPKAQLNSLADAAVHSWFVPQHLGGQGWAEADLLQAYMGLSAACLTTAFILTQRAGAVRRIAEGFNPELARELLPLLLSGEQFATVGISHLTTSRRHAARPALLAEPTPQGWLFEGQTPWVTGALDAEWIVTGAEQPDGTQIVCAVSTKWNGVAIVEPERLLALSASCTCAVNFHAVQVPREYLLAGPEKNVLNLPGGAKTGGLATSALALGHTQAALELIRAEAALRGELAAIALELSREQQSLVELMLTLVEARGSAEPGSSGAGDLRARANSLALRSSQAALAACKGAGYVQGHPAGRLCREALFFLVWSCPQPVVNANLCELAGLS
jgi:alkylation response protein AidB-like acyl-CoA dehydrogenase